CNNRVNVIYEENDHLWFGTEGGISILNKNTGQYEHYSHDPHNNKSIGSNAVLSFCRDKRGNMWIGTWAGGLNLFDEKTKTFKRYLHDPKDNTSIGNNNISCITCTKDVSLWIATMGGGLNVYNYENDSFKKYTTDFRTPNAVFSNDWVQSVYENSYGELWISTISAVDIFNRKKEKMIKFYYDPDNPKSISYYVAIMIFEDSKQNMWIGTANGLNLFNRADSSFIHYHEQDGLPNNCIRGICEDDHGNLWISTNNGLSKFVNGINHPSNPIFHNYSLDDGLQGNEFKSRCAFKGKDGKIYFGGNNGYNVFHPDSIYENNKIPDLVITDFLLFNKPVEIGSKSSPLKKHLNVSREVRLNHNQSVFSIQYASLNYLSPKENQYAFMLEGFEKEWNFVGNQRLATYTNLNPGEYIFRVKGSNNDGIWNDEGISVKITIVPPIWKTTWAYLMYVLIFGGIIFTIYRFQIKRIQMRHELILEHRHAEKLEEINEMKSRFFSNITHEFRTPLTLIMAPVKQFIAGDMTENFKKTCQMILRNSEKLYQLINQLLDLSKIEAGHMPLKAQELNIIPLVRTTVMLFRRDHIKSDFQCP
ncbi:MAG: two-component regulator propeller domain-containing protein, partial [bacterium]